CDRQHAGDGGEVDADAVDDVHRAVEVARRIGGAAAEALEDDVRGLTEQPRAGEAERYARDGEAQDRDHPPALRCEAPEQAARGRLDLLRLLRRRGVHAERPACGRRDLAIGGAWRTGGAHAASAAVSCEPTISA